MERRIKIHVCLFFMEVPNHPQRMTYISATLKAVGKTRFIKIVVPYDITVFKPRPSLVSRFVRFYSFYFFRFVITRCDLSYQLHLHVSSLLCCKSTKLAKSDRFFLHDFGLPSRKKLEFQKHILSFLQLD